jgi:hypothetical protein
LCCRTRKTAKEHCDNEHSIRLDELEQIVLDEINKLLKCYYDEKAIGKIKAPKKDNNVQKSMVAEIKELEEKIKRNDARMAQMYTDKLDGIITVDEFTSFREKYKRETYEFENRINILTAQLNESGGKKTAQDTKYVLDKYRHIDTLTFEIANEFISKIYIGKIEENGSRNIEIKWKI